MAGTQEESLTMEKFNIDYEYDPAYVPSHPTPAPVAVDALDVSQPPPYPGDDPPPDYQAAIANSHAIPAITFCDIYPRCLVPGYSGQHPEFEKFGAVTQAANDWLRQNPWLRVVSCETVDRRCSMRGDVDTATSHRHQPSNGEHSFVRILRLWLTTNTADGSSPQQLGYVNLIPQIRTKEEDEEVGNEFPGHVMACSQGMVMMGGMSRGMYGMRGGLGMLMKVQRYQTMKQVIDVFNKKIQAEPLPGSIISVESVDIKKSESFESVTPDLDSCYWYQRNHTSKHFLSSIRVYYINGKTCTQQIDVTSFPPANLSKRGSSYQSGGARYEGFGSLLERTSRWINSQNSLQLLNLQSPFIRYSSADSTGLMPDSVDTETTNTTELPTSTTNYLRIIRVFSLQSKEQSVRDTVTSKVFFPEKVAKKYDTVQEVLQKAIRWIVAAGMENRIVGAETFEMPVSSLGSPPNVDATKVKLQRTRGNHWITCFRLYLEGPFIEPEVPKQPNQKKSSTCCCL